MLVGHPLDTIKVHLQTQDPKNPKYRGVWHCMKSIVAEDRVRGLYRGISSPMLDIGMVNAIVFGIYGNVQRHTTYPDSLSSHFLVGSIAGFAQSIVCAPMELAKTRIQLQLQPDGMKTALVYKGIIDCGLKGYAAEGPHFFVRGLASTLIRAFPMNAACFFVVSQVLRLTKGGANGNGGADLLENTGDGVHGRIEQQHYHWLEEMRRKRDTLNKSMKALGEFNEAVHHSEVEELVHELFPC